MARLGDNIQTADWKSEKHVPVIECSDRVTKSEIFEVKVSLGKEIAHPNTTGHHIRWLTIFFHAVGEKFNYQVGHYEFNAHGESGEGPDKGTVYTNHQVTASLKISKPGTIHVLAFCNIHGLWESSKDIAIV